MRARFCPSCGKTNIPFVGAVCQDCFLAKNEVIFVSPVLEVTTCPDCAKILVGGQQVEVTDTALVSLVEKNTKTKLVAPVFDLQVTDKTESGFGVEGTVTGKREGAQLSVPLSVRVQLVSRLCHDCSRLRADYWEAKVQLRFASKNKAQWETVRAQLEMLVASTFAGDSLSRVTKVGQISNGLDLWIGSKQAAKHAVNALGKQFGVRPLVSKTQAGMNRSGKAIFRYTFLVRIP